jgi:hypothetical protein
MRKYLKISFTSLLVLSLVTIVTISCSKDNDASGESPVITSVSASVTDQAGTPSDLSPITQGQADNYYIINGSGFSTLNKVFFNDVESSFNPNMVTNNHIIVKINKDTPYENASNKLRIITGNGTAEYNFVVAPPAPLITGFNSINTSAGNTFKISGSFFLNPKVKVGTTEATIISSSLTEIQAVMPSGSNNKYVSVTTISGTSTYDRAVGSAVYDDTLQDEVSHNTWNNQPWNLNFTDDKAQGNNSMRIEFGGWYGLDMLFNQRTITQYKAIRMQIKGTVDNANASIKVVFNGDNGGWSYQIIKPISTNWSTIEIPFSDIGNPTFFNKLTLQESGGFGGNTILIDNIGFVLQ